MSQKVIPDFLSSNILYEKADYGTTILITFNF